MSAKEIQEKARTHDRESERKTQTIYRQFQHRAVSVRVPDNYHS